MRSDLTLNEGAVKGWSPANPYHFSLITAVASVYEISLDTPFKELADKEQNTILYGDREKKISIYGRRRYFEGVIPNLNRRYTETDSTIIHAELKKYRSFSLCPACSGSRLCEQARSVRLGKYNLPHINVLSIDQVLKLLSSLRFKG